MTVIENPLSGERITIRVSAAETGGTLLAWELLLAPGGRVPSGHAHPEQEERFTVLDGRMAFRVGRRRILAGTGDTVTVPPGTAHHFANPGPAPARVAVETRPALGMEDLLAVAAALARDRHTTGRALPRPLYLAVFMHDFAREVRAPYLPAALVRPVVRVLARLAAWLGVEARYRALRYHRDGVRGRVVPR